MRMIKQFLRQHPTLRSRLVAWLQDMRWKRHIFNDWQTTVLFKKRRETPTPFGFTLVAENYLANRMMQDGVFEPEETAIIQQHLKSADLFVDIGANIGFYTCLARAAGKIAIAIEPQPRNLNCLYTNLLRNNWGDTEVFPLGLSAHSGLVTLYGASGPSASLISGWADYSNRYKQVISVSTLDTLLGDRFVGKRTFIKLDVEGTEYDVLCGGEATLAMNPRPKWLVEICLSEYHPNGMNSNYAATFELFWQHGYEVRTANRANHLVQREDVSEWIRRGRSESGAINYICQ